MIAALEQERLPQFDRTELGEMQLQMLELGGRAAQEVRAELLVQMVMRRSRTADAPYPDFEPQRFFLESFNSTGMAAFRYESTGALGVQANCEFDDHPLLGLSESSITTRETFATAADGSRVLLHEERDLAGGEGSEQITDYDDSSVTKMIERTIAVAADTRPYEADYAENEPNPVLGRNYGLDQPMLRPAALTPVMGQLMIIGANSLRAAGEESAAEVRFDFNGGRYLYGAPHSEQQAILWARSSEDWEADFGMNVTTLGGSEHQFTFATIESRVDEYNVDGRVRRTVSRLWQNGSALVIEHVVKHGGEPVETAQEATIDDIAALAGRVEKVARGEYPL